MKNIFVYGTLKRGFPNHSPQRLERFYITDCKTVNHYSLVIVGQYYVPVLLQKNNEAIGEQVLGELYRVDQQTLDCLDKLEGVGKEKGYRRIEIEVLTDAGEIKIADVYIKNRQDLEIVHSTLSTNYALDSRYIIPELRNANPLKKTL